MKCLFLQLSYERFNNWTGWVVPETNGEISETSYLAVKNLFNCLEDSFLDIAVTKACKNILKKYSI